MPALEPEILGMLKCNYKEFPNFVETGTFLGQTIIPFEPLFENLYTIEIKKELYDNVTRQYKGNKIKFYHGDTMDVLPIILRNIKGKSIIFLDAHYSAGITGTGPKHVPLYEELEHIMKLSKNETVIIVDDFAMFGRGPNTTGGSCNWEDINVKGVIDIVTPRLTDRYMFPSSQAKNDRLILHLKAVE
tara:strand:+ start:1466 stop:2029 length:564 start_codon:yes stop_codon:yes gene_type:complete